jgi:hypothetical protein
VIQLRITQKPKKPKQKNKNKKENGGHRRIHHLAPDIVCHFLLVGAGLHSSFSMADELQHLLL